MKKILSVILAMVLMMSAIAIPVSAKSDPVLEKVTVTMTGSEASESIKEHIKQAGFDVTDTSTIQLIPISSSLNLQSQALMITNRVDNTITKDVLFMVTDEGVGFEQGGDVSTRAGTTVEFPPYHGMGDM